MCPWIPQYTKPPTATAELSFAALVEKVQMQQRRNTYAPILMGDDETVECPDTVPPDYPREFPVMDV